MKRTILTIATILAITPTLTGCPRIIVHSPKAYEDRPKVYYIAPVECEECKKVAIAMEDFYYARVVSCLQAYGKGKYATPFDCLPPYNAGVVLVYPHEPTIEEIDNTDEAWNKHGLIKDWGSAEKMILKYGTKPPATVVIMRDGTIAKIIPGVHTPILDTSFDIVVRKLDEDWKAKRTREIEESKRKAAQEIH